MSLAAFHNMLDAEDPVACVDVPPRSRGAGRGSSSLRQVCARSACVIEYQHDRPRRCGRVGDGVTLINPRWAPEQSLTVTALSSAVEGVLVLQMVGEVDLASMRHLWEHLRNCVPSEHRGLFWTAPRCHFWGRAVSPC